MSNENLTLTISIGSLLISLFLIIIHNYIVESIETKNTNPIKDYKEYTISGSTLEDVIVNSNNGTIVAILRDTLTNDIHFRVFK